MDGQTFSHPSFGLIRVTRCSSAGTNLFASDARHHQFVHIEIDTAEVHRDLSHNWLFGKKRLIEFYMTESQWARFVSAFGDGTGTPVTLRYYDGKDAGRCPPPENFKQQFADEVKERVNEAVAGLKSLIGRLKEVLAPGNKTMGKKELAEVLRQVEGAAMQVQNNLPYIEKCFNEKMEKASTEAKIEFEAIVNNRLREIGLETARNQLALPQAFEESVTKNKQLMERLAD